MKKIFTLFAIALFVGTISARAEKVICSVSSWTSGWVEVAVSFEAELTVDAEGVYTLTPFFNSNSSISFKVGEFGAASDNYRSANIEFVGNISEENGYAYLMDSSDPSSYMRCYAYDTDGSGNYTIIDWPYVYGGPYSYVGEYMDFSEHDDWTQYVAVICMNGYDGTTQQELSGYYITLYFDALGSSGISNPTVEGNSDAEVEYFNLQGMKVSNADNGVYIRRQGNSVKKVVMR